MLHVLSARQFDAEQLDSIFQEADELEARRAEDRRALLEIGAGHLVSTLFYEPSTRTRLSFEASAHDLGMGVLSTENAKQFSSAVKGESLEHSILTIGSYADAIVLRHDEVGGANRAAAVSTVPIINAGDKTGEHPTQSILDLYTIKKEKGQLDGLTTVIGGDLMHGRTARSLAIMLSHYPDNRLIFVSTPEFQIGADIKAHLDQAGTKYEETDDMYDALSIANVVYWTRLQLERLEGKDPGDAVNYVINQTALQVMQADATLLHPLPIKDEIETSVDNDERAKYLTHQVRNGRLIRRALLRRVLDLDF